MEQAQGLGLRTGFGGSGVMPFLLSFFLSFFLCVLLSVFLLSFVCQRGRRVAGGKLRHLAGSPRGGGDISVLPYSNSSQYSMIKQQQHHSDSELAEDKVFQIP